MGQRRHLAVAMGPDEELKPMEHKLSMCSAFSEVNNHYTMYIEVMT